MIHRVAFGFGLGLLGLAMGSFGDENLKPAAQVVATEQVDFAPGGLIRVDGSYGDLYVESWDQPRVEMTVTKLMPYDYKSEHPEISTQHLEAVRVVAQRRSPTELEISTVHPHGRGHAGIEYEIRVPRNSRLAIRHGVGLVSISGVTGDITASGHRGDIMLWLPTSGAYSIDAKCKLGKVSSDFTGVSHSSFLVGQRFASGNAAPSQRLHLRMGFGGITIKPILPESQATR